MNNNDLQSNIAVRHMYNAAIGANATVNSKIIDRKGYGGVEIAFNWGAVTTTGTNVAVVVKEGDVTGTMTSVADSNLLGTETLASLLAATPRTAGTTKEVTKRLGYKGAKRYVQLSAVQTGVTSVGCIAAQALMFNPSLAPISNP